MYKPNHPVLNTGNEKHLTPAVIAGGGSSNVFGAGYGGYGQGTDKDNISTKDMKDLDSSRAENARRLMEKENELAIKRDWCRCLQCGTLLGGAALGAALLRR